MREVTGVGWSKGNVQQLCPHLNLAIGAASGEGEQKEESLAEEGESGQGCLQDGNRSLEFHFCCSPNRTKLPAQTGDGNSLECLAGTSRLSARG